MLWNEEMSKRYDPDAFHNHPNVFIRWTERCRVRWVHKLLTLNKEDRLLEVGCGAGNILAEIEEGERHGIDISNYLLEKAKKRLNKEVYLEKADAQNLPFRNGSFDRIICSEVIEHVINPLLLLSEMARVLRPDGIAVLSIPNETLIMRLRKTVNILGFSHIFFTHSGDSCHNKVFFQNEWHLHYFDRRTFCSLLHRFFSIRMVKVVPTYFFPLHWVIQAAPLREKTK